MFKGDFGRLRELHGRVGAGKVVRRLVEGHIARVEQAAGQPILFEDGDQMEFELK